MTKQQFLSELQKHLIKLPVQDRQEILQDYNEYFTIAETEGKTEQQVIAALGSPKQIAKELLATYYIEEMEKSNSPTNMFHAIWAGIGLSFLNIVFLVGPFIGLIGALLAFWVAGFSLIISPLLVIAGAALTSATFSWFDFFLAIMFCGFGFAILIGCYYLTALLKKWSIRYLKFNVSIVKGETRHA